MRSRNARQFRLDVGDHRHSASAHSRGISMYSAVISSAMNSVHKFPYTRRHTAVTPRRSLREPFTRNITAAGSKRALAHILTHEIQGVVLQSRGTAQVPQSHKRQRLPGQPTCTAVPRRAHTGSAPGRRG